VVKFQQLANEADVEKFPAGKVIFTEGEPGHVMYVIRTGTVELRSPNWPALQVSEGDIFGELALLDSEPRSATAVAVSDCELAAVDQKHFHRMIQQTPFFATQVMKTMAERLRRPRN
jgi:CRP-like cAMP-binding protein